MASNVVTESSYSPELSLSPEEVEGLCPSISQKVELITCKLNGKVVSYQMRNKVDRTENASINTVIDQIIKFTNYWTKLINLLKFKIKIK